LRKALGQGPLQGPRGRRLLISKIPLYRMAYRIFERVFGLFTFSKTCQSTVRVHGFGFKLQVLLVYRGTSLIRRSLPLGPYARPARRALAWS
jgi:hypothetical protein